MTYLTLLAANMVLIEEGKVEVKKQVKFSVLPESRRPSVSIVCSCKTSQGSFCTVC